MWPRPADDEDFGPGPDAAAAERVQLPHAGMAQHRAEQVLDVVRVQPGLRGLGAAGGDEVFLARRVKGGEVVLLLDFGDLLDDAAALGQQVHQLLVDAVNLLAQRFQVGLGHGRRASALGVDWISHRGQSSAAVWETQGAPEPRSIRPAAVVRQFFVAEGSCGGTIWGW